MSQADFARPGPSGRSPLPTRVLGDIPKVSRRNDAGGRPARGLVGDGGAEKDKLEALSSTLSLELSSNIFTKDEKMGV